MSYLAGIVYLLIGSIWTIPWWKSAALEMRTGISIAPILAYAVVGALLVCTLWPVIPIAYLLISAWKAWA
ncbi:hypothetical protein IU485_27630 [Nocardia cyriacigeorgica]|uniref:hypothetical protein n=1 Tax=Nocardia cyriacigeorgica TaxID=135487 RepID=UPI001893B90C|nr:hypothetical protein [Nocardia cyriacigeorgica]MBF6085148.1 hypothetical protein [Nocardia cyriacigeorgica]